jgi:hypothetical protein
MRAVFAATADPNFTRPRRFVSMNERIKSRLQGFAASREGLTTRRGVFVERAAVFI